jgi:hypothetical protein
LVSKIERNKRELEPQQDIIWSRFCAIYLPAMVSRYLDPPSLIDVTDQEFARHYQLYNADLEMMVQIQHIPYFMKYLRSNKSLAAPGKRLPSVLAQRLLDLAPHLDLRMRSPTPGRSTGFYESFAGSCIQLLSTLLAFFVKVQDQNDVVRADTRQGLLLWLAKWGQRYNSARSSDPFLGDMCMRTCAQLSPTIDMKRAVRSIRRRFKNLDECALPTCTVKDNCKICSK